MALKLGSSTVGSLYLGSSKVSEMYLGNVKVYSAAPQNEVVIGGKTYPIVDMPDGSRWLGLNLDLVFDGLSVPTSGASGTSTKAQAMYYNYDETTYGWNGYKCGLLYNAAAAFLMNKNRSTLFPGWHVATPDDWSSLSTALGGDATPLKAVNGSAGTNWPSDWGTTDEYGFAALPGGQTSTSASFWRVNARAYFWTPTNYGSGKYYYVRLWNQDSTILISGDDVKVQNSVRLVKDT